MTSASFAQAPATPKPLTGEPAAVKKLLEQKFPGATVTSVTKSPYFGLYEVMFDEQLVYTDAKVTYVIVGNIYDAIHQEEPDRGETAGAHPRRRSTACR